MPPVQALPSVRRVAPSPGSAAHLDAAVSVATEARSLSTIHVDGLKFEGIDHVVLFSGGDPATLWEILANPRFPRGITVVTGEMSLFGWHGGAGVTLASGLKELKRRATVAHQAGDESGASALHDQYRRAAAETRKELVAFALRHAAGEGVPSGILRISREKGLTLWVGAPRYDKENDKLYNCYFCVKEGGVIAHHDKKFLYSVERDVFDEPPAFDRDSSSEISLVCWEAEALNPHYHKPSPLQRVKAEIAARPRGTPLVVRVAAYWPEKGGVGLRGQVSKAVRRGEGGDKTVALRPEGALALVSNDGAEAYVMGPSRSRVSASRKAEVYGVIRRPGMIRIRSDRKGDLEIGFYDRRLKKG